MKDKSNNREPKFFSRIVNSSRVSVAFMFYFLLSTFYCSAQDSIVVSGQFVNNTKYAKVLMKKFAVGSFPIGGASIKNETFSLSLPPDIEPGVYRFQYAVAEGEKYVDIIINGEEKAIDFSLQADDDFALPNFTASEENKQWYAYLSETRAQFERIDLLNQFINAYPNRNAKVVVAAEQEWQEEKALYWERFNTFISDNADAWACELVANRPYYFTNPKEDPRLQDVAKRTHFWEGFDATNPQLINTPLYTEHILNYLRYWMNLSMNFSAEEKTEGFKRAVDVIIRQFSGNEETHEFAYKYLTLGFKEIGEEKVLQYLDENYSDLAEQCFDDIEKTEFEKRMEGYAALRVGNKAPDFELNITSGKLKAKRLHKLKAEKTLLVFWSSTCPHCLEELPDLNAWAAKHKDVHVLAVSIDNEASLHKETIIKFPNITHTCDYKAWDTEAAQKYYVVATPTFILLDKNKSIVGKYSSFKQVEASMGRGLDITLISR